MPEDLINSTFRDFPHPELQIFILYLNQLLVTDSQKSLASLKIFSKSQIKFITNITIKPNNTAIKNFHFVEVEVFS